MSLSYSAGGSVVIPPPEKKKTYSTQSSQKTNGTQTVSDRVPDGEQWTIQAISCSTSRTVNALTLGIRDNGGHIVELGRAEHARDTSIRWTGEIVLSEGEAIVMIVENVPGNSGAVAKMVYRGYKYD